jgi:DNA-directed RNA polymerase subunit RPC12/RpoP
MTTDETEKDVLCPECGHSALYTTIVQHFAIYTGEMDDDGWPAEETMTARGFTIKCPHCGFMDGEPPTW